MKKWDWKDWAAIALIVMIAAATGAGAAGVIRRGIEETQEAYDLDTGQSYGLVQVRTTVELPGERREARVGLRPAQFRPGLLSSARTELRMSVSCEEASREVVEASATLAYLWQTGTLEEVLAAIADFPEKKTGCTVSINPSRWTPLLR